MRLPAKWDFTFKQAYETLTPMKKKPNQPSLKLSDQIKAAISNCEVSRYRISKETGVSEATLSRFMVGARALSQNASDAIGLYLGMQITVRGPQTTSSTSKGSK